MMTPDSSKSFGVMSLRYLFFHCSLHGLDRCVEIHLTFLSSGVKPYACTMCDMRFIQRYQLERHSLTHTGTSHTFSSFDRASPDLRHAACAPYHWLHGCFNFKLKSGSLSLRCQMLMFLASAGSFINIYIVASVLCVWNDMMIIEPKGQHHTLAFSCI